MKSTLFALSFMAVATSALAQELPSTEDLLSRIDLPGFWEATDLRVVAEAMVGTPVAPRAQIRFEVDASPSTDLYIPIDSEQLGPFLTIIASTPRGTLRTIYGTMDISYTAGKWTGPIIVENPVDGLGNPQDAFSVPTLILGSDRQQSVSEDLRSSASAELKIALDRDRQQLMEQNAAEQTSMKAAHLAALSSLRKDHDQARIALEEQIREVEAKVEALSVHFDDRFRAGEALLKEKLDHAEAGINLEIDTLNDSHQAKLRELKAAQSTEFGSVVATHLAEMQTLEIDHAKAVGSLIAEQEREMAEVTSKLETRKTSLAAQVAVADEVLALQASLTARQTAIQVNDESIKAAEQQRQEQFGQSLDGIIGTWTGTIVCKHSSARDGQLLTIDFIGEEVVGRSIAGELKNVTWGGSYNSTVQIHLVGNDLTMPLALKATANNPRALGVAALDLTLQTDGWMVGQSPDDTCTDVRLSKS